MNIKSINNIAFKGINVSKPSKKEEQSKGSIQDWGPDFLMKRWRDSYEVLATSFDSCKPEDVVEISRKVDKEKPSRFCRWGNELERFLTKREALKTPIEALEQQRLYLEKMKEIRLETLEQIRQIEKGEDITKPVFVDVPKTGISKIAGYEDEISVLEDEFIIKVKKEKAGEDQDVFGSLLFFGPQGNGKTYITGAVADATNSDIVKIRIPNVKEEQIKKGMQKIYAAAENSAQKFEEDRTRTIIFIDEVDKMLTSSSPILDEFSEFIKTCSDKYHCSVFAATNNPLDLAVDFDDPDIFPIKMSIDTPDDKNVKAMFDFYLQDRTSGDVDIEKLLLLMREKEQETQGKYNNGQIKKMTCDALTGCYTGEITQDSMEEQIKGTTPDLTSDLLAKFQNDYDELIGKEW